jgi:RNA polymerase sigma factor (sigma-70 family)
MNWKFDPTTDDTQLTTDQQAYVSSAIDYVYQQACSRAWKMKKARRWLRVDEVVEDLASAGFQGLVKAAQRFDPGKSFTFLTYAVWYVLDALQRQERHWHPIGHQFASNEKYCRKSSAVKISRMVGRLWVRDREPDEFEVLIAKLPEKERTIMRMLYAEGLTGRAAAKKMKISQTYLQMLAEQAHRRLRASRAVRAHFGVGA